APTWRRRCAHGSTRACASTRPPARCTCTRTRCATGSAASRTRQARTCAGPPTSSSCGGRSSGEGGGRPRCDRQPGMDADRRELLEQLYRDSREHDAAQQDRLLRFRNVEPDSAALLAVLIRATGAQRLLEIGTSNGYSTIWLADAAEATGGELVSLEIDPERTELARANLARAGLGADLRTQDAGEALAEWADGA